MEKRDFLKWFSIVVSLFHVLCVALLFVSLVSPNWHVAHLVNSDTNGGLFEVTTCYHKEQRCVTSRYGTEEYTVSECHDLCNFLDDEVEKKQCNVGCDWRNTRKTTIALQLVAIGVTSFSFAIILFMIIRKVRSFRMKIIAGAMSSFAGACNAIGFAVFANNFSKRSDPGEHWGVCAVFSLICIFVLIACGVATAFIGRAELKLEKEGGFEKLMTTDNDSILNSERDEL
eukprot:TRINITY_DN25265_c0_g1_i1.p1 TRINITY_DN25265_c0_g1~~TRINITY_DN25265_c0_g1_i1.p1  ORF type:complete len:229 (-),score=50.22 TRINITY_DN25265_c0_g1_i1:44-730(-)